MSAIAGGDELWVAWKRAVLAVERAFALPEGHPEALEAICTANAQEKAAWQALQHLRYRVRNPPEEPTPR